MWKGHTGTRYKKRQSDNSKRKTDTELRKLLKIATKNTKLTLSPQIAC